MEKDSDIKSFLTLCKGLRTCHKRLTDRVANFARLETQLLMRLGQIGGPGSDSKISGRDAKYCFQTSFGWVFGYFRILFG